MGFEAHLWRRPRNGEAETPYDFEEICAWSGLEQYGWMHQWLRGRGIASRRDTSVRLLTSRDVVAFYEELVQHHNDGASGEDDEEIMRVADGIAPFFETMLAKDRFTYYASF